MGQRRAFVWFGMHDCVVHFRKTLVIVAVRDRFESIGSLCICVCIGILCLCIFVFRLTCMCSYLYIHMRSRACTCVYPSIRTCTRLCISTCMKKKVARGVILSPSEIRMEGRSRKRC